MSALKQAVPSDDPPRRKNTVKREATSIIKSLKEREEKRETQETALSNPYSREPLQTSRHPSLPSLSIFTALPHAQTQIIARPLLIALIQPYYDAINRRRIQAQEEHEDSTSQRTLPPTPGDRRHLKPLAASRIDSSTEIQPAREEGRAILVNVRGLPRRVLPVRLRQLVHQP